MAEHAIGEVIVAAALAEAQGRLQQAALLGRQSLFGNLRLGKPLSVSAVRGSHEKILPEILVGRIVVRKDWKLRNYPKTGSLQSLHRRRYQYVAQAS